LHGYTGTKEPPLSPASLPLQLDLSSNRTTTLFDSNLPTTYAYQLDSSGTATTTTPYDNTATTSSTSSNASTMTCTATTQTYSSYALPSLNVTDEPLPIILSQQQQQQQQQQQRQPYHSTSIPFVSCMNWNERFQAIYSDYYNRRGDMAGLLEEFGDEVEVIGKIIISERFLPLEQRTIRPLALPGEGYGVAGGEKYVSLTHSLSAGYLSNMVHIYQELLMLAIVLHHHAQWCEQISTTRNLLQICH
jgi:hypothetical protein